MSGEHPVRDTVSKRYRQPNCFQHECFLDVRVPRVRLSDGALRQVDLPWAGKLSGFTLLFESLVLMLCPQMTFAAGARLVRESGIGWPRSASATLIWCWPRRPSPACANSRSAKRPAHGAMTTSRAADAMERGRSTTIPHAFGELALLNPMHAALIRASVSPRGVKVTELELQQV